MVGFFDSGIGGRCVLDAFSRLMPDEPTVYVADSGNCPYGNKSGEIFCLKNDKPKNKLDVCDLLNGGKDLDEKRKEISFVCPDFKEQSEDHYTYNDYLNCLNDNSYATDSLGDGAFYEQR